MAVKKASSKKAASGGAAKKSSKASSSKGGGSNKEKSQTELISTMAEKTGLPKTKTKEFLEVQAELIISELKKIGSVQLPGIGKFKLVSRAARKGRNPATGQAITIKATKTVKLAGGKRFKERFK